jgi:hypothetical protein
MFGWVRKVFRWFRRDKEEEEGLKQLTLWVSLSHEEVKELMKDEDFCNQLSDILNNDDTYIEGCHILHSHLKDYFSKVKIPMGNWTYAYEMPRDRPGRLWAPLLSNLGEYGIPCGCCLTLQLSGPRPLYNDRGELVDPATAEGIRLTYKRKMELKEQVAE